MKNWPLYRSLAFTAFVLFMLNLPDKQPHGVPVKQQGLNPQSLPPLERRGNCPAGDKEQPRNHAVLGSEKWATHRD
jgi:hypothetical protein